MKKVLYTKYYSIKQMENMIYNLRKKFKVYCSIGFRVSIDAHTGSDKIEKRKEYYIYHEIRGHTYFDFWPELQQQYREMLREEIF